MPEYYFTDGDWTGFATRLADNILLSSKPCKGENFFRRHSFCHRNPGGRYNKFELVETGKVIRKFLAPAALLNCYQPVVVTDEY